ncbi:hypothetical protein WJX73_010184 [Symbiochloris irregularis]|uniref:Glycosyltransferase family 92 protein n=1 Tax=Symbiochloris irregularis TaxID=706552 RepID=A0AAW1NRT0_9CHLO
MTQSGALLALFGSVSARRLTYLDYSPVALCLAVKDEHKDLREWVTYHVELGVSRFYIYDNNSSMPLMHELTDFIKAEVVEYHYLVGKGLRYPQFEIYNRCLRMYRDSHTFMGFIDADEFIVIPDGRKIEEVLTPYEKYGGLVINWRQIGYSGHDARPDGGILANYWQCFAEDDDNNRHVKTIVVTKHATTSRGAHCFNYKPGSTAVNVRFEPVDGPFSWPPDFSQIFLYHYVTKSREDYKAKMIRGSGAGNHKPENFFGIVNTLSTSNCTLLLEQGKNRSQWISRSDAPAHIEHRRYVVSRHALH